jgi:hypothetical protein
MKRSEVKPTIDKLVADLVDSEYDLAEPDTRLALETAFVAGVRSNLKFTSDAQFAKLFKGEKP